MKVIIRIDTDQIVKDRRISFPGKFQYRKNYRGRLLTIIQMILGEEILEKHKIIEVKILEVDIEVITEMKILKEVEIGLEKDNIQVILEGMIKAVVVDQDQV